MIWYGVPYCILLQCSVFMFTGRVARDSLTNFQTWMRGIVVGAGGLSSIVRDVNGREEVGMFHLLTRTQIDAIFSKLGEFRNFNREILNNQYSGGKLYTVNSDRGRLRFQQICIGPFQD